MGMYECTCRVYRSCCTYLMLYHYHAHWGRVAPSRLWANTTNSSYVLLLLPVTPTDIISIMQSLKNQSWAHERNIIYGIQECCTCSCTTHSFAIQQTLKCQTFPNILKKARVTQVHWAGKTADMNNYRPISNLSILSKIFQNNYLETALILPGKAQHIKSPPVWFPFPKE